MSDYQASTTFDALASPAPRARGRLLDEVLTLLDVLLQPGKLVREVEEMGRLLAQAHRIEARDPEAAERLRRRASQACA